jgi:hypothetical protein
MPPEHLTDDDPLLADPYGFGAELKLVRVPSGSLDQQHPTFRVLVEDFGNELFRPASPVGTV